jgi:Spy/CpxP family protein refolding chaperone
MNKPWKLILLLAGIFLLGVISGGMVGLRLPRAWPPPMPPPEKWADLHLKRAMNKLALTPEQLAEIEPIVRRRMKELGDFRAKYLEDNQALRARMEAEVAAKLTPEQRALYAEHNRRFRERQRRLENGGRPGDK